MSLGGVPPAVPAAASSTRVAGHKTWTWQELRSRWTWGKNKAIQTMQRGDWQGRGKGPRRGCFGMSFEPIQRGARSLDRRNMGESRGGPGPAYSRKGAVGRYSGPSSFTGERSSMTCVLVASPRMHGSGDASSPDDSSLCSASPIARTTAREQMKTSCERGEGTYIAAAGRRGSGGGGMASSGWVIASRGKRAKRGCRSAVGGAAVGRRAA